MGYCGYMTKSVHFIPGKSTYTTEEYARIYNNDIVILHEIPYSIISDRGSQFTSHFWKTLQKGFRTYVKLSTAFNHQTDGQVEHTIQTLEDMLRSCVIDFKVCWNDHLPLIEFFNNNSYHLSISMAPFESLYGKRYRSHIVLFEVG